MAEILTTVYTEPTNSLGGIGIAKNNLGRVAQVYSNPNSNKTFKFANTSLYGPSSGSDDGSSDAPVGAAAQSWSDG
jgi:hypothetical protein